MALFSDIDWVIIAGVGVLLLFGSKNGAGVMRTVGRYYARMMSMKQQMIGEVTKAAEIPAPQPGRPTSLRAAFLGVDSTSTGSVSGIPAVVTNPPAAPYRPTYQPEVPWNGPGIPTPTWSVVLPPVGNELEGNR